MAKTLMRCPFNEKMCKDCELYRGRHYYLCTCEKYRGYIKSKQRVSFNGHNKPLDLETIKKLFEPWSVKQNKLERPVLKIKLKVIDMESGTQRYVSPFEANNWKWGDPNIMRVVNGGHITSWEKLLEIMHYQEQRGIKELVIYEAPRFMLLGGG